MIIALLPERVYEEQKVRDVYRRYTEPRSVTTVALAFSKKQQRRYIIPTRMLPEVAIMSHQNRNKVLPKLVFVEKSGVAHVSVAEIPPAAQRSPTVMNML